MLVELVVDAFGDSDDDDDDEDDADDDGCTTSVDVMSSVMVLSDCDIVLVTAPVVVDIDSCGVTFAGSDEVTTEEFIFASIDTVVGDFVAVVDAFGDSGDGDDTEDDGFTTGVDVMFSVVLLSDCNIVVVTTPVVVVAAEGMVAFAVAWVVEGMVTVAVVVVVEGMVVWLVVVLVEGMVVVIVVAVVEGMVVVFVVVVEGVVVVLVVVVEGVFVVLMVCTVEGVVVVVVAVEVFAAVVVVEIVVEIVVVVVVAGVVVVVITGTKTRKPSFYARVAENKIESVGISGERLFST